MRLAFDLDGTLADLQSALMREARALFPQLDPSGLPDSAAPENAAAGDAPTPAATARTSETADASAVWAAHALSSAQQQAVWRAACSHVNFWETLDEIEPAALARLAAITRPRKWEVIFLTSRPETEGDSAQLQSHRWLVAHGFPSPSIFVVHGSRGRIAAALNLDVVVDDRPENCLDVAIDSSARPILVWRDSEEEVPAGARQLGIGTVSSIGACLDILERLDQEEAGAPGMVDRLKRFLGLKSKPTRMSETPAVPPADATETADGVASR